MESAARRRVGITLYCALLGWAVGILWLSSLSPAELPDEAFVLWDKLTHVIAYTAGGWLAATALRVSWPSLTGACAVVAAAALIAAFGVLDEAVQTRTPGRTGADLGDWTADLIGAVLGVLLSLLSYRCICREDRRLV